MPERPLADALRTAAAAGAAVTAAMAALRILDPASHVSALLDAWCWLAAGAAFLLLRALIPGGNREDGA